MLPSSRAGGSPPVVTPNNPPPAPGTLAYHPIPVGLKVVWHRKGCVMRTVTPLQRCIAAMSVVVASSVLACAPGDPSDPAPPPGAVEVPADEPMDAILNEHIASYRPDGVTYDGKSESRADGYIPTNLLLWSFVGSSDDAVATAAQQMRDDDRSLTAGHSPRTSLPAPAMEQGSTPPRSPKTLCAWSSTM